MAILFRTTKELELEIDEYLDSVSQAGLVFRDGVRSYLNGDLDNFNDHIQTIKALESKADNLRRGIENKLYTQTLIPEHRGDVLGILESSDDVIDTLKETLVQFEIESPYVPEEFHSDYLELTEMSVSAGDTLVSAVRAFFRDINAVKDHLHKVYFYEKEADRIGDNVKRKVFKSGLDLSQKFHLRYFALHIQHVSDRAEDVADRLAIYTIKRTI